MLLKVARNAAGAVIVLAEKLTRPQPMTRTPEQQAQVRAAMENLSLYQLQACPFCVKTRRALYKMNAQVELRDIGRDKKYRTELEQGGGRVMVPCLRIEENDEVTWLYESSDIIRYLQQRVEQAI